MNIPAPKYPIGTVFKRRGKQGNECRVVDIHYTYNTAGELVQTRYVATHTFMGQTIKDQYPVTSIDMSPQVTLP